jgi:hypothetical protein
MNHLILIFTIILCFTACEKEEVPSEQASWIGEWNVTAMSENDSLFEEIDPPKNLNFEKISISIPESDSLKIAGNTFKNRIVFSFDRTANQKVDFGLILSTREGEDRWGLLFTDNIRKTTSYTIADNKMHFRDTNNLNLITFIRP